MGSKTEELPRPPYEHRVGHSLSNQLPPAGSPILETSQPRMSCLGAQVRIFQEKLLGIQGQGCRAGAGLRTRRLWLLEGGDGGTRTGT